MFISIMFINVKFIRYLWDCLEAVVYRPEGSMKEGKLINNNNVSPINSRGRKGLMLGRRNKERREGQLSSNCDRCGKR